MRQEATPAWAHRATAGTVLHPRIHAECPGASACWQVAAFRRLYANVMNMEATGSPVRRRVARVAIGCALASAALLAAPAQAVGIGAAAPAFALPDGAAKIVSLRGLKGHVVYV